MLGPCTNDVSRLPIVRHCRLLRIESSCIRPNHLRRRHTPIPGMLAEASLSDATDGERDG